MSNLAGLVECLTKAEERFEKRRVLRERRMQALAKAKARVAKAQQDLFKAKARLAKADNDLERSRNERDTLRGRVAAGRLDIDAEIRRAQEEAQRKVALLEGLRQEAV